jgi:hypothetical protein
MFRLELDRGLWQSRAKNMASTPAYTTLTLTKTRSRSLPVSSGLLFWKETKSRKVCTEDLNQGASRHNLWVGLGRVVREVR